jgi:periplasmic protein TonB
MALRCVLFSSDPGAIEPIRQALANLGVEGEHCSEAVAAVEKVCRESFQILIVDWDKQPDAGALLLAARERKVSERPLTLAIVSQDANVPKALQAGANSILRKPILIKQVTDSLARARDLLRARESAAQAAAAAGAGTSSTSSVAAILPANDATLRAGEFLQSAAPATQLDTESEMQKSIEQSAAQEVDALKDLEPTAAAVVQEKPAPVPTRSSDEPRGLQWYLNQRAAKLAPAAAPTPPKPDPSKPELLGFEQTPSFSAPAKAEEPAEPAPEIQEQEKRVEAELFAYIAGEGETPKKKEDHPRPRLGKGPILFALALAACAVVGAPQAPWHPPLLKGWARARQATHAWLNPQPVTTAPAPASHENFGRAGDEYKLPVAENIPDATTDPSQIRVVPVVDPTAKKPNNGANADPNLAPAEAGSTPTGDPAQSPGAAIQNTQAPNTPAQGTPGQDNSAPGSQPAPPTPAVAATGSPASGPALSTAVTTAAAAPAHSDPATPPLSTAGTSAQPTPPKNPQPRPVSTSTPPIPSSLKSQMASMTPDASGNKAPETALPSIEPVNVPEATQRGLLMDQPAPAYPASAKGQQGTVVLQVLVGRDGTVQDAKFLQGSLAFARTAIDGVKQWKFKPYMMNGRPVSVQTSLTLSFKPGQ